MPYVGNIPAEKYASFEVQHFTTSATTSYTLTHAVANELDIRLVINNVVQQPGGSYSYTAAGTTLTLSVATAGTDTMYCVYIGKAVQTVTPPDGSVSESKLQVSNSPTNGQVLSAQSGAAGGLTWAADAAGTVTGYTNGVDNRVITSSGTTTLNGETNFIYNGTLVGAGATGASADLGDGVHVRTSDSGATVNANFDEFVAESSGNAGLSILAATDGYAGICFGDSGDNQIGSVIYYHGDNSMQINTSTAIGIRIEGDGAVTKPRQPAFYAEISGGNQDNIAINTPVTVLLNSEVFDIGDNFASNTFTAPITGKYHFSVKLACNNVDAAASYYDLILSTSNKAIYLGSWAFNGYSADATYFALVGSCTCDMDTSDTAVVTLTQGGGTAQTDLNNGTYMTGHLVC